MLLIHVRSAYVQARNILSLTNGATLNEGLLIKSTEDKACAERGAGR